MTMRHPLPANVRPPLLGLAAALLLTGCGPENQLSLDLRSVSITVPRLITPAVELVPAAQAPPPVALPPLPPVSLFLPPVAPQAVPLPSSSPAPRPVAPTCPKPSPFEAPALPEGITVEAPPAAGATTQVATGSFASTIDQGSLAGAVTTTVVALPSASSTTGQRVDSWRLERKSATGTSSSVELYQLVHPSTDTLATAPGIYLVGMAWRDPVRGDLAFQPEGLGLQILPLPVQLSTSGGAQYAGSATDPATLTTLSIVRNVTGRKRVDLCGDLVETFTVEMTGALTTPDSQRQLAWTQQLATAYGGVNVEETLTLTSPVDGFTWTRNLRGTELPPVPEKTP